MYKVFLNNKILCFTENINNFNISKGELVYDCNNLLPDFKTIIEDFAKNPQTEHVYFLHNTVDKLFDIFSENFKIIKAAGGFVRNSKNEYLFIFRRGKWDLPKGKIDKGETIEHAAIREVEEECGVQNLIIIKELDVTYHIYDEKLMNSKNINLYNKNNNIKREKEQLILKYTYWFDMLCDSYENIKPQTEEDISEVKWFKKNDFEIILDNTFPSVKELILNFIK